MERLARDSVEPDDVVRIAHLEPRQRIWRAPHMFDEDGLTDDYADLSPHLERLTNLQTPVHGPSLDTPGSISGSPHRQTDDHTFASNQNGRNMLKFMSAIDDYELRAGAMIPSVPSQLQTIQDLFPEKVRTLHYSVLQRDLVIRLAEIPRDLTATSRAWQKHEDRRANSKSLPHSLSINDKGPGKIQGNVVCFYLTEVDDKRTDQKRIGHLFSTGIDPRTFFTSPALDQLAAKLQDYCERIPGAITDMDYRTKRLLIQWAFRETFHQIRQALSLLPIKITARKSQGYAHVAIFGVVHFFDSAVSPSDNGWTKTWQVSMPATQRYAEAYGSLSLDSHILDQFSTGHEPRYLPKTETNGFSMDSQKQACALLNYIRAMCHGKCCTMSEMGQYIDYLKHKYLSSPLRKGGVYGGHLLWSIYNTKGPRGTVTIKPSDAVVRDLLRAKLPVITCTKDSLPQVLSAMETKWITSANVIEAWRTGCMSADLSLIVEEGEPIETKYDLDMCDDEEARITQHMCRKCQELHPCFQCKIIGGLRYCIPCSHKLPGASEGSMEKRAKSSFLSLLVPEARQLRLSQGEAFSMWQKLWSSHYRSDQSEWWDDYFKKWRPAVPLSRQTEDGIEELSSPFNISFDAIDQVFHHDNRCRLHVDGNIACTACAYPSTITPLKDTNPSSVYINMLKHIQPVISIRLIRDLAFNDSRESRSDLLLRVNEVYKIHMQLPYQKTPRLNLSMSHDEVAAFHEQCRTGVPHENAAYNYRIWTLRGNNPGYGPINCRSDEEIRDIIPDFDVLLKIVQQMEEKYPQKLLRRVNGVPCPFDDPFVPENWSWVIFAAFSRECLHGMTILCNKYFLTTCTVRQTLQTIDFS